MSFQYKRFCPTSVSHQNFFQCGINFHFESSLAVNGKSDQNLYSHFIAHSQLQKAFASVACGLLMRSSIQTLRVLVAVCGDWLGVTDSTAPSCWFSIVSEASASASTDCFSADLQTPSDQLKHVCAVCFLKAHAQPCMRYYGKHIFSNCIMK